MPHRLELVIAAVFGLNAVAFGAFAAHGLSVEGADQAREWLETGAFYQMVHGLALLVLALFVNPPRGVTISFAAGVLLFSGSLYALALGAPRSAAMAAPVGGSLLLVGWGWLLVWALRRPLGVAGLGALLMLGLPGPGEAQSSTSVSGPALVRDDGSLSVGGRRVVLFGIDIPLIEDDCRLVVRPRRCAPAAVLVLDDLVQGFVRCRLLARHGRTTVAQCTIRGDGLDERRDLAAELLVRGFALAGANAPSRYRQLERLAEARGLGLFAEGFIDIR